MVYHPVPDEAPLVSDTDAKDELEGFPPRATTGGPTRSGARVALSAVLALVTLSALAIVALQMGGSQAVRAAVAWHPSQGGSGSGAVESEQNGPVELYQNIFANGQQTCDCGWLADDNCMNCDFCAQQCRSTNAMAPCTNSDVDVRFENLNYELYTGGRRLSAAPRRLSAQVGLLEAQMKNEIAKHAAVDPSSVSVGRPNQGCTQYYVHIRGICLGSPQAAAAAGPATEGALAGYLNGNSNYPWQDLKTDRDRPFAVTIDLIHSR